MFPVGYVFPPQFGHKTQYGVRTNGSCQFSFPTPKTLWDFALSISPCMFNNIWLVVEPYPSEKYESQWEGWHPIYEMENKIPWFQTTNQISSDCFRAQHLMKICYFGASKTHQNPSGNGPWLGTSTSGAPYPEIMGKLPVNHPKNGGQNGHVSQLWVPNLLVSLLKTTQSVIPKP